MNLVAMNVKNRVKAGKRSPYQIRRMHRQALAGGAIGAVAICLMALSLSHLAAGIELVTGGHGWESWAMAIGIDCGFVALELGQIAAFTEKVKRTVARFARPTILATMLGSAALNALAFAWLASGWMIAPAVILGVAVPVMIYSLTRCGVALWQN